MPGSNILYGDLPGYEGELPPNILRVEDADDAIENKAYKVRDIYFVGKEGFVNWTFSITNLRAGAQTRGHSHPDNVELCHIMSGEAFIHLDGVASRVNAGTYILIGKTVHHKVVNASTTQECVFSNSFPGHLVREGVIRKKR